MKKIIIVFAFATVMLSFLACARGITPYEAANGKARCGRYIK